ncbi:hypothetical protein Shyhy01_24960 [Streptomyces hygroscopicus subsp. hygroscopicus]|nr:hypothetical protein Shyhy01_24960 [Streptomyces hygroscopicus subsp. hygroscopicus]
MPPVVLTRVPKTAVLPESAAFTHGSFIVTGAAAALAGAVVGASVPESEAEDPLVPQPTRAVRHMVAVAVAAARTRGRGRRPEVEWVVVVRMASSASGSVAASVPQSHQ